MLEELLFVKLARWIGYYGEVYGVRKPNKLRFSDCLYNLYHQLVWDAYLIKHFILCVVHLIFLHNVINIYIRNEASLIKLLKSEQLESLKTN